MMETGAASPWTLLLVGLLMAVSLLVKGGLGRSGVPALVGYLAIGVALSVGDWRFGLLPPGAREAIDLLAGIGVVVLLFRVGLETDLAGLIEQLPRALVVWVGDVTLSGALGYAVARYGLGAEVVPSLFVAVALMATSVSIPVSVWQERRALRSPTGELLVDVAEADDISSVVAMVLLFAAVPVLGQGSHDSLSDLLLSAAGWLALKALLFAGACLVFARFLERPLTRFLRRITDDPDPVIVMAGAGVMIAAAADWLGFSLAVGALLAGLLFSRDPEAVRLSSSFTMIHDLFAPFFFIGIGSMIEPGLLASGLLAGGVLLVPAVIGKSLGAGLPAAFELGWPSALLIGASMVPRAEIALIVAGHGRTLGDWAMPPGLFAGLMTVSLVTALLTPPVLRAALTRWPPDTQEGA